MRVTVCIPCYNQADTLSEAIESALAQSVPCEVIIVNDGSPDNSKEIASHYPVKLVNQVNKGLPSARNTAIMNMTGEYLLPLDADDILTEFCVEKLLEVADETKADVVAPSIRTFGTSNETIVLMDNPQIMDFLSGNRLGYFSMIKREALLEVGGYSPRMVEGWEDLHLWFDLLTRGKKIATVKEPLVLYRTKDKSMWRDAAKHSKRLWEQIFKDFPNLLPR